MGTSDKGIRPLNTSTAGTTSSTDHDNDMEKASSSSRRKSRYAVGERKAGADQNDPFGGDEEEGDVQYRTLTWWQAAMIMIAETISLGILSLPSVLATVGMVPGVLLIAGLGAIATYTGYIIGQFKMAYPFVHSMGDAGHVLFSPLGPRWAAAGREFLGAAQVIFLVFSMASHVLTWTICLNTLTNGATCTIVWSVVGFVLFWICDLPRTLKGVSYMSFVSFASIAIAVIVTMAYLGADPPDPFISVTRPVALRTAFLSVSNIIFAYAGHVAFFGFISEFRRPAEWPKALFLLQAIDTAMYIVVAVVVYRYAGSNVKSPALGSAGPLPKKIAWGVAIPTIVVAGVIYGHVAAKYIYVRLFRGTRHMSKRTPLALGSWAGITLLLWLVAWVIAESIPNFNDLLALISALFASWFTYGLAGVFWLFLNKGRLASTPRKIFLTCVNILIVLMGAAIMGLGLWSAGVAISKPSTSGGSWTCKSDGQ